MQGNTLLAVSERFREVTDGEFTAEERWLAFVDVDQALRRVQATLINPPGTTPTAGPVVDRLAQLVVALRRIGFANQPAVVLPVEVPKDRLLRLTAEIIHNNRQIVSFLRERMPPSPYGNRIRLHAERLAGAVGAFRAQVPGEDSPRALQLAFQPVRDQALVLDGLVALEGPFPNVKQRWLNMRDNLERVEEAIGAPSDFPVAPEPGEGILRTTKPPVNGGLRTLPQPPWQPAASTPGMDSETVPVADRALGLLDSYRTTLRSATQSTATGPLQNATRELRGSLARFREAAATGAPTQRLRDLQAEVSAGYVRFRSRLREVAREDPALDSFQVDELHGVLERLRDTVP